MHGHTNIKSVDEGWVWLLTVYYKAILQTQRYATYQNVNWDEMAQEMNKSILCGNSDKLSDLFKVWKEVN